MQITKFSAQIKVVNCKTYLDSCDKKCKGFAHDFCSFSNKYCTNFDYYYIAN